MLIVTKENIKIEDFIYDIFNSYKLDLGTTYIDCILP